MRAAFYAAMIPALASPTFYVSPKGSDSASGLSIKTAFKTLQRAEQAVRLKHGAVVEIRGGEYGLQAPFLLTEADSGTSEHPTTFRPYKGEHVVISGGRRLRLERQPDGTWAAHMPGASFQQLFVNGDRRYRPRWPKAGYSLISTTAPATPSNAGKGYDRFGFAENDINPDWARLGDVEVLAFHNWTMDRLPLAGVDGASKTATLGGPTLLGDSFSLNKGIRYLVENVPGPGPGEWYLDRASGALSCVPKAGEDLAKAHVVVPQTEQLLVIKGDPAKPAHDIVFEGIDFEYTSWRMPPKGHAFPQADVDVRAAIELDDAQDCAFKKITVAHTGGWALALGDGCHRDKLLSSHLADLGAGGVMIGKTAAPADPKRLSRDILVGNCRIEHGGRIHPAATGVWIGQSAHDFIEHNDIFDFYYTGISVGWSWGYGPSPCNDHLIFDNRIEDIGQEVLSDMGGIYTLGLQPGTSLFHNLIKNVNGFYYGGWGIYFDEGTSNVVAKENLVVDCKTGGFHQHYGQDNLVENNIFYGAKEGGLIIRTRAEDHRSLTFQDNIAVSTGTPMLGGNWTGSGYLFDHNLYWSVPPGPLSFAGKSWDAWRASGQDANSLVADPMFVDPEAGNFRFRSSSPALKVGFHAFDTLHYGCQIPGLPTLAAPAFPTFQRTRYGMR